MENLKLKNISKINNLTDGLIADWTWQNKGFEDRSRKENTN